MARQTVRSGMHFIRAAKMIRQVSAPIGFALRLKLHTGCVDRRGAIVRLISLQIEKMAEAF